MGDLRQELLQRIPWRAAALWGVTLGATFVIRGVYDIFNPTTDWAVRSQWSTLAGIAICFSAGFQSALRRKDFGSAIAVTMLAILIGSFAAVFGRVVSVFVISTFHELDLAREVYWALDVPLQAMLLLGGSAGAVGAAVALGLTRLRPPPS